MADPAPPVAENCLENHVELIDNTEYLIQVFGYTHTANCHQNPLYCTHNIQFLQTLKSPWEYYG